MSIEHTPNDNQPNLEPQKDIMRLVKDAQETFELYDEFDQWTWGTYKSEELSAELHENPIRVSVEVNAFCVQIVGQDSLHPFISPDGHYVSLQGYVGHVATGKIADVNGFCICLVGSNLKFKNDQNDELLEVIALIPISKVLNYHYLPSEQGE